MQITVLDHYINDSMTAIITEAEIKINAVDPPVTLRVAHRFMVIEEGKIIEQENHFDPRDVTNPGWQNGRLTAIKAGFLTSRKCTLSLASFRASAENRVAVVDL